MTKDEKVKTAKAGQRQLFDGDMVTVSPSCHEGGHWYCVTHKSHYHNNFAKDSHLDEGDGDKCVLGWVCSDHEVLEEP